MQISTRYPQFVQSSDIGKLSAPSRSQFFIAALSLIPCSWKKRLIVLNATCQGMEWILPRRISVQNPFILKNMLALFGYPTPYSIPSI